MTLDELVTRMRALGFLVHIETMGNVARVAIGKLVATRGNRIDGARGPWTVDLDVELPPEVDGPSPYIRIEGTSITFAFYPRAPGPPQPYEKELSSIDELHAELMHFYFDPDSPMSSEPGFVPA